MPIPCITDPQGQCAERQGYLQPAKHGLFGERSICILTLVLHDVGTEQCLRLLLDYRNGRQERQETALPKQK